MGLTLRWVGDQDLDRVAETRLRSYASIERNLDEYRKWIREDARARPGDYLLAEQDGDAVGTATSLSMTMWVRGSPLPCQGVAWVGTIKTHRRRASDPGERGIASQLMDQTIRMARERGQVISALMPFRASFYEHFGYGIAERQHEWTIPLGILPRGDCSTIRFITAADLMLIQNCRQRMVQKGQCDLERSSETWQMLASQWSEGFCVVDQIGDAVHSWMWVNQIPRAGQTPLLRVADACWDSQEAFLRQLRFLASLRDQHDTVVWVLPADLAVNRLLAESQLPHRPVSHPTAKVALNTRMQVRILDHIRFLGSLHLSKGRSGQARVLIIEPEGEKIALHIEAANGRITANRSTAEPDIQCTASTWASIACGEIQAFRSASIPGLTIKNPAALDLLTLFADGPSPFSTEYF